MTTLGTIDPRAIDLPPGMDTWTRYDSDTATDAIIMQSSRGAVELWQAATVGRASDGVGGVEIHSPVQLHDDEPEPDMSRCSILDGPCWSEGSSIVFSERFLPLIQAGDPAGVLRTLAEWHAKHFGSEDTR